MFPFQNELIIPLLALFTNAVQIGTYKKKNRSGGPDLIGVSEILAFLKRTLDAVEHYVAFHCFFMDDVARLRIAVMVAIGGFTCQILTGRNHMAVI